MWPTIWTSGPGQIAHQNVGAVFLPRMQRRRWSCGRRHSHAHQNHYGLACWLPKETPFLIGKAAEAILAAANIFTHRRAYGHTLNVRSLSAVLGGSHLAVLQFFDVGCHHK